MNIKNLLVTGGAGFVGSNLCKKLLNDGFSVTTIDDLTNGKIENIVDGVKFIKGDLSNKPFFNELMDLPFDAIIHCAAQSSNELSFKNPKLDIQSNLISTYNLLEFCRIKKIDRFIFTSSMSVYGQACNIPSVESDLPLPDSFYSIHKLASEHYIRLYFNNNGIHYTTFRLYTTYGYGQNIDNRDQGLLSIYISYIINNDKLVVKGSPERKRDIISVYDVTDAINLSINNSKTFNKTYNLGTGKSLKIKEIIALLVNGMGYDINNYPIEYREKTSGDPFETLADIDAIMKDLDWEPKISPVEGIELAIKSYNINNNKLKG